MTVKKAIFLDRDGTLNKDTGYTYKIEDLTIKSGVIQGLKLLRDLGYIFFIITNQSGINRGYFTVEDMFRFNNALLSRLRKHDIYIKDIKFCPHVPEQNCPRRKPSPLMVNELIAEYNLSRVDSFFIGDKISDIECGNRAGVSTVLISNSFANSHIKPDYVYESILNFAEYIRDRK